MLFTFSSIHLASASHLSSQHTSLSQAVGRNTGPPISVVLSPSPSQALARNTGPQAYTQTQYRMQGPCTHAEDQFLPLDDTHYTEIQIAPSFLYSYLRGSYLHVSRANLV